MCRAQVTSLEHNNGVWRVTCGAGIYEAPVVLNAAGAWVDTIARLARGLPLPPHAAAFGLTAEMLGPARLRRAPTEQAAA